MDSRKTINSLIGGKGFDRVGSYDFIWEQTVEEFKAEGMPATDSDSSPVDVPTQFGWDMHRLENCGMDVLDWKPLVGFEEKLEESQDYLIYRDGCGAVSKKWKKHAGTREFMAFDVKTRQEWEKNHRPKLLTLDTNRLKLSQSAEQLKKWKQKGFWTFHLHQFVWENLRQTFGDERMFFMLIEEPQWIEDFCRVYTDFYKMHFAHLFKSNGLCDGIWITDDLAYKQRLFASPAILEKMIFPYYVEIVKFFNSYGLPVIFHSCGYVHEIIDMIIDAGFIGLNPLEVAAGNDIGICADKYRDKLVFIGGLDKRILESDDRAEIKKAIISLLTRMKMSGARYIFGSDHSISTSVKYSTYMYALDVYRENMMYN